MKKNLQTNNSNNNSSNAKSKPVMLVAGGSGGHIYPALAVAKKLIAQNIEVYWLGSSVGMEKNIIKQQQDIKFFELSMRSLRGKGLMRWLIMPYQLAYFIWKSCRLLHKLRPQTVVCMGGFVTAPMGIASWTMSVPLILHEQNSIAGLSNRLLAPLADKVFTGFSKVKYFKKNKWVGNPVRQEIIDLAPVKERFANRQNSEIRIAILGGSQGALAMNQQIPAILANINEQQPLNIWHQTGSSHYEDSKEIYHKLNIDAQVSAFVEDMPKLYGWADLIIGRAGAMTISELIIAGLGSVLIPFPFAVDDHQSTNAKILTDANAGLLVQQNKLTEELPLMLEDLLIGERQVVRDKLQAMALSAQSLAKADIGNQNVASYIADSCLT